VSNGILARLSYVLQSLTQSEVSREIGIPRSTLQYDIARGIPIASEYEGSLRNLYQRTVYSNLREEGFSSAQARRFSWYSPETVTINTGLMREKVLEFSVGQLAQAELKSGRIWTDRERADYLATIAERVRSGLRKSKAPLEDIVEAGIT